MQDTWNFIEYYQQGGEVKLLWKLANNFPSDEEKNVNMWQFHFRELLRPVAVEVLHQSDP